MLGYDIIIILIVMEEQRHLPPVRKALTDRKPAPSSLMIIPVVLNPFTDFLL
jgi:hypothetical protein